MILERAVSSVSLDTVSKILPNPAKRARNFRSIFPIPRQMDRQFWLCGFLSHCFDASPLRKPFLRWAIHPAGQ